jgi:hypothetical protein
MTRTSLFLALTVAAAMTLTGCVAPQAGTFSGAPTRFSAPPSKYPVPTAQPDGTIKPGEGGNLAQL